MTERNKWGRIPAKLIEVDQDFCLQRWGENKCNAGPESNYQIYSKDLTDTTFWEGDTGSSGAEPTRSTYYEPLVSVALPNTGGSITASDNGKVLAPVFDEPTTLYCALEFDDDPDLYFLIALNYVTASADTSRSFEYNFSTDDARNIDSTISNIEVTLVSGPTRLWRRITFEVEIPPVLSVAYSPYLSVSTGATGVGATTSIAMPQISLSADERFIPTEDEPKEPDAQPCFNTLSSCQNKENYSIKDQLDALTPGTDDDDLTYTGNFEGDRNEGIYVEFYFCHRSLSNGDFSQRFLDVGNILAVDYRRVSPEDDKLTFIYDGQEIDFVLDDSPGSGTFKTYKIAAYVTRSGTMQVRGVDQAVTGASFSEVPQEVVIRNNYVASGNNAFEYGLADFLLYDYENQPINVDLKRKDAVQKGDLEGDALLYIRFNGITGLESDSGIVPTTSTGDAFVSLQGLASLPDFNDFVTLDGFGEVELLEPPLTWRFTERSKSSRLPETLPAIPSVNSSDNKPSQLQVGGTNEDISALGSRDQLTVMFEDHPYSDLLADPYVDQRSYTPKKQGTFWGKWLARNVYRKGFSVRYVSGYELPSGGFERVHSYSYFLDKVDGPNAKGKVTLKAFDILQSLRADKAVYPAASTGFLDSSITAGATSFTLAPAGIGDDEYPSSFRCRIGGEGFDVTRSGDTCSISTRGLYGGATSHSADDTVQIVGQIDAEQIHDAAYIIITAAVPELEGFIPKAKWDGLATDFLPRLYTADITEPTGVEDLLGELVSIAPIYFYTDVRTNLIELGIVREPTSAAVELTENEELLSDTIELKEYPKERIDEVWIYYRIRDAAGGIDEPENYSQRFILVNPIEQKRRGERSIKRVFTRWLEGGGSRDTAEEVAESYINRFQNTPIRVSFDLDAREGDIWLGDVAKLISRQKQTVTGENVSDLNYQVISAKEDDAGHSFKYLAQSYEFFSPVDPDKITITILPEDTINESDAIDQIDLRELYDETVATEVNDITFVIAGGPGSAGGTIVGGGQSQAWSLRNPNNWPWSPTIEVRVDPGGVIAGRGGDGGDSEVTEGSTDNGGDGQTGFLVEYATTINNLGIIGGGGGGGGSGASVERNGIPAPGGGGGGGAGRVAGDGGTRPTIPNSLRGTGYRRAEPGEPGTTLAGGSGGDGATNLSTFFINGGRGGRGGGLGQAGEAGETSTDNVSDISGGLGGAAGLAIDGISNVTFVKDSDGNDIRGDIRGNTT